MKKNYFTLLLLFLFSSAISQEIEVIDVSEMESIIHEETGKTKIINFWATWCKPCVEEIPYFEALNNNPEFEDFEIVLISLDFIEELDSKLRKFVEKRELTLTVKLLNDTDYNSWIDKIDSTWSGDIPATLLVNNKSGKRKFFEKQFTKQELENELLEFRNQL